MTRKGEVCSQKVMLSLKNKYRQFFNYSNRHGAKNDHPQQNYWERDAVRDIYEPVMQQVHSTFVGITVTERMGGYDQKHTHVRTRAESCSKKWRFLSVRTF